MTNPLLDNLLENERILKDRPIDSKGKILPHDFYDKVSLEQKSIKSQLESQLEKAEKFNKILSGEPNSLLNKNIQLEAEIKELQSEVAMRDAVLERRLLEIKTLKEELEKINRIAKDDKFWQKAADYDNIKEQLRRFEVLQTSPNELEIELNQALLDRLKLEKYQKVIEILDGYKKTKIYELLMMNPKLKKLIEELQK